MKRHLFNTLTAVSLLLAVAAIGWWVRSYRVGESFTFGPRIESRAIPPADDRPWFEGWRRYVSVGSSRGRLIISYHESVHRPRQEAEWVALSEAAHRDWGESDRIEDEMYRRTGRPPPPRPPRGGVFRPRGQLTGYSRSVPQFGRPPQHTNQPAVVTRFDVPWLIEVARLERRVPPPGVSGLFDGGRLFVSLPWLVPGFVFSLPPLAWAARRVPRVRTARRIARGSCPACGYDLTGNVSGVCPECGQST